MSNTAAPERGSIDTARAAWSTQRHDDNASRREAVAAIVRSGVTTLGGIAKALQVQGVPTPSGATKWHRAQVARLLPGDAAASQQLNGAPPAPAEPHPVAVAVPIEITAAPVETASPPHATRPQAPDAAPALVHVVITASHVRLPVEDDGTVLPGWERAGDRAKPVSRGMRLCVPPDLIELLESRRQAVRLGRP